MPKIQLIMENNQPLARVAIKASGSTAPTVIKKEDTFVCLIDTGATVSCISSRVASILALNPYKQAKLLSANIESITNIYRVDIYMPFKDTKPTLFASIEVAENAHNNLFDCIIGMDIISKGVLIISGNNFIFSV